jgi:hypothetical protein
MVGWFGFDWRLWLAGSHHQTLSHHPLNDEKASLRAVDELEPDDAAHNSEDEQHLDDG